MSAETLMRVRRALAGDAQSIQQLWEQHRRWVAAVLLVHAPHDAEIDDLIQDVGVAMVAKMSGLREPGAFKPWLRTVAISIAKTTARRRSVRRSGFSKLVGWATGAGESERRGPENGSTDGTLEHGQRLLELAGELPDGYREPLLLKCVHDMSYRQIGETMGLPETTIETRIARARRMLREKASERMGLGGEFEERRFDARVASTAGARETRVAR